MKIHRIPTRAALLLSFPGLALAVLLAAGAVTPARSGGEAVAPRYLETVLDNGMRVALVERREVPMVSATTIVGAGSALETEDFSGASHFLEHLLFNGTSTMSQEELYDAVDRIGGYNNAHTDEDHTYYTMLVPAEHARAGLEIQAAMLFDSVIPEEKFDKERKIVLEEIAKDRSRPGYERDLALREALAPGSAWGRPVIGTYDSLAGIERERVVEYYRRRYVPDNMLLLLMGDFEAASMLGTVREVFGAASRGGELPAPSDPAAAPGAGTFTRVVSEDPTPVLVVALPAPGPCEEGGREASVLASLLSSESGPLRRVIGPETATRLGASYLPRPRGSQLSVRAELAADADPGAVRDLVLRTLEETARQGLAQPGLGRAEIARVTRADRAGQLLMGQRVHYFGMLWADTLGACGGELRPLLAPGEADAVDPDAVASIARRLLGGLAARARVVLAGPYEAPAGPRPLETPAAATAASAPPAPEGGGGDRLDRTLDNGLRVLALREAGAAVTGFHVLVRDRTAREPAARSGIADLLHRMLPLGTALSGRAQVASRLERIGAELKTADADFIPYDDYYTSPSHSFVRLEVPSDEWIAALDLLAELVRLPALDADELETLREARAVQAEKNAASPAQSGGRLYREAMLGSGHPLVRPVSGTAESLRAVTHEELQAFARTYLEPSGMILGVVGPEDPAEVLAAVEERFLTASGGGEHAVTPPWPVTGAPGEPRVSSLGADQALLYLGRIAALPPADRAGVRLLGALLSDRLVRTLREEEGLAYRLGAGADFSATPDRAWFTVQIGTRPENEERALAGLREQMLRLREEMAGREEIDRVRAERRARALMRRMTAVNRARYLSLRAFSGVPAAEDVETLDAMDRVDRETLVRLAKEWLDPSLYRVVIVR